jgi:hypothetical protein
MDEKEGTSLVLVLKHLDAYGRIASNSFTLLLHSLLSLLCRNVSKKHSYLSCWLNLHLTKVRPYPASKHYDQGMPISTPGIVCWFDSRSPRACLSERVSIAWRNTFFKSASKLFVGVYFLRP